MGSESVASFNAIEGIDAVVDVAVDVEGRGQERAKTNGVDSGPAGQSAGAAE